jgi:hypothetical protein
MFTVYYRLILTQSVLFWYMFHLNALPLVSRAGSGNALVLLLEPVLLRQHGAVLSRGALNVDRLRLVRLQVARDVRLLGRLGGLRDLEGLDGALGIGVLDLGDLVVLEFAEVQFLHQVGWRFNCVSRAGSRAIGMSHLSGRPWA